MSTKNKAHKAREPDGRSDGNGKSDGRSGGNGRSDGRSDGKFTPQNKSDGGSTIFLSSQIRKIEEN